MNKNGFFIIDKPLNVGSTDCVRVIKKLLNQKKVGHAGTLDFLATGVLVICVGKATKLIEYLQEEKKTYVAELKFGEETDTLDREGQIINTTDEKVSLESLKDIIDDFKGQIKQIPPMYSALKKDGQRLYDIARRGETVERKPRNVEVYNLEILEFDYENQICKIKTTVSAGTYIRTLGDDIGKALNNYAHLISLRRTSSSGFSINKAVKLKDLNEDNILDYLHPMKEALSNRRPLHVNDNLKKRLLNGMTMKIEEEYTGFVSVFDNSGNLLGVGNIFKTGKGYMLKLKKHLYIDESN